MPDLSEPTRLLELIQAGHQVVVVDNLVNSNRKSLEVVEKITGVEVPFYEADIRDTDTLRDIFKQEEPTGVIHFAGLKAVGESTRIPLCLLRQQYRWNCQPF